MNHTWKNDKCGMCGCERRKISYGYFYLREMIMFGMEKPNCIDWELENSKTID